MLTVDSSRLNVEEIIDQRKDICKDRRKHLPHSELFNWCSKLKLPTKVKWLLTFNSRETLPSPFRVCFWLRAMNVRCQILAVSVTCGGWCLPKHQNLEILIRRTLKKKKKQLFSSYVSVNTLPCVPVFVHGRSSKANKNNDETPAMATPPALPLVTCRPGLCNGYTC